MHFVTQAMPRRVCNLLIYKNTESIIFTDIYHIFTVDIQVQLMATEDGHFLMTSLAGIMIAYDNGTEGSYLMGSLWGKYMFVACCIPYKQVICLLHRHQWVLFAQRICYSVLYHQCVFDPVVCILLLFLAGGHFMSQMPGSNFVWMNGFREYNGFR